MSDLKPCPFCDGEVIWCDCGADDCPQITCPHCGQFDFVKVGETMEGAKLEAESTWNSRPVEQRLAATEAELVQLKKELFVLASDIAHFKNRSASLTQGVFDKAEAVLGRLKAEKSQDSG